jgi:hypothetical protein
MLVQANQQPQAILQLLKQRFITIQLFEWLFKTQTRLTPIYSNGMCSQGVGRSAPATDS